jgi:ABC-type lipoprotein release transport system permease subunit
MGMLAALAWRNLWRQPRRTLLSLTSIAFAGLITVFLLALQQGVYATMKYNVLRMFDGFAQVQPVGYADDPELHKVIDHPNALAGRILALPKVTAAAPRAQTYAILANGERSYGAAVIGVQPAAELKVSSIASVIQAGRYLRTGDDDAIVLGDALARNLQASVGDTVTLLGSAHDGSVAADVLRVVGVFHSGADDLDRQVAELPLARFQSAFIMGDRANTIAVAGRTLGDIQRELPALRALASKDGLAARDWTALQPALNDAILLDASISLLWYVSLVVIVVFIILNTLLMSVLERTREFGMLLAIGMRPSQIGRMLWLELVFLAGGGCVLGVGLGSAVTAWLAYQGIAFPGADALFAQWGMPSTLYPSLDLVSALAGPLAIALSIAVAGVVPYQRVRRLRPVAAMRAA